MTTVCRVCCMVGDCLLGNTIQPKHPLCATSAYLFMHSPLLCMYLNKRERERERERKKEREGEREIPRQLQNNSINSLSILFYSLNHQIVTNHTITLAVSYYARQARFSHETNALDRIL